MVAPATPGAVDVFLRDTAGVTQAVVDDAVALSGPIIDALSTSRQTGPTVVPRWGEEPQPAWLGGSAARDRTVVWVAVGMVMTEYDTDSSDALALLRAYAYSHDTTIDAADALVDGILTTPELRL